MATAESGRVPGLALSGVSLSTKPPPPPHAPQQAHACVHAFLNRQLCHPNCRLPALWNDEQCRLRKPARSLTTLIGPPGWEFLAPLGSISPWGEKKMPKKRHSPKKACTSSNMPPRLKGRQVPGTHSSPRIWQTKNHAPAPKTRKAIAKNFKTHNRTRAHNAAGQLNGQKYKFLLSRENETGTKPADQRRTENKRENLNKKAQIHSKDCSKAGSLQHFFFNRKEKREANRYGLTFEQKHSDRESADGYAACLVRAETTRSNLFPSPYSKNGMFRQASSLPHTKSPCLGAPHKRRGISRDAHCQKAQNDSGKKIKDLKDLFIAVAHSPRHVCSEVCSPLVLPA